MSDNYEKVTFSSFKNFHIQIFYRFFYLLHTIKKLLDNGLLNTGNRCNWTRFNDIIRERPVIMKAMLPPNSLGVTEEIIYKSFGH